MSDHEDNQENQPSLKFTPVTAAQHGPPTEVHFINVIAAEPRHQHTSAPVAYQRHPMLRNQFFYSVPEQLLQSVCRPQDGESFDIDEELLQLEEDLSQVSGDHGASVGFWNGMPIRCALMHSTPMRREDLERLDNLSEDQAKAILRAVNERLLSFSEVACGYAGWLMTNPDFVSELNVLVENFGVQMNRWGTHLTGLPIPSWQPPGVFNPTGEAGWAEYDSAVVEFCVRWRLTGLAGPRIPIPMKPMMSGQFPLSIVEQLMRAGGVFNWPDTFPLLARNELRDMLASALGNSDSSEHLADWQRIIGSSNKAKNEIGKFERRFRLQHFWRLLRERHPQAFERRLNRIELAFVDYLGVDVSTIKLDRRKIREQLGDSWDLSDNTFSLG